MPEDQRETMLAQPSAMKEVYGPDQDTVNSHTIVRGPDAWHLFYGPGPGGHNFEKRHATSDDLVVWTRHEPVLLPGDPGDCDHAEISEASVVRHDGRWFMVYQCRPERESSRRFALAVSDDLWHWEKVPGDGSPVFIPLPEWSGWTEKGVLECKDPCIIPYEGRFLMYFVIDFFTDVMTGRIDGAELCHRIDAAKQLVKYGSKDAAEFLAKYKGVPCGHSTRGRPNPADPCTAEERSLVDVTLNAPATLTRDFLTVLSGIDEFLMARLIRAQTADGVTVIDFLDDVMQDRTDGFKTHHRIAAAKELIVHIIRDEQPAHTPSPSTTPSPLTGEGWGEGDTPAVGADPCVRPLPGSHTPSPSTGEGGARPESPRRSEGDSPVVPAEAGTQGGGGGRSTAANPARTEPVLSTAEGSVQPEPSSPVVPANTIVVPAKAGTQRSGGGRNTPANSPNPEPNSSVVPAEAGTQGGGGGRSTAANPARTEPVLSTAEGSVPTKEPAEEPAPAELTPAERRIKERPEKHWHEPDPYGAPIDSTHPGRSPPW